MRERPTAARRTQDLRERLLSGLLRVIAFAGILAFVPSAYLSVTQGLWFVLVMDGVAFAYTSVLAFVPRLPYRLKVYSLVWMSYVLGVMLIIFTGPFGAGHLFIFAFVFLASLFGDVRRMILANALAVVTHIGFAIASGLHLLQWPQDLGSVIVISANFVLVSLVLSFSANYLIRGYASAASDERRLRETLEMMLREIEHRVKNNLQVIASLVSFRSRETKDPARALEDIKESLSAISVVHQLLYRRSAFYLVEIGALLASLVRRFQKLNERIDFTYEWEGTRAEIDGDQAVSLGVMINEIVMNSTKHAFEGSSRGCIFLRVSFDEQSRHLELTIGDDGRGMKDGSAGSGDGLRIIETLARQLKAEMRIEGPPGVVYRFAMRVEKPDSRLGASERPEQRLPADRGQATVQPAERRRRPRA